MAQRRNRNKKDETLVDLVEVTESAQDFFERNSKVFSIVAGALLLLVGAFFAYKYLIQAPKDQEAREQMFQAEFQFAQDSFALALTNPGGGFEGFLDIIENYSGTKASNISNYYAGVSYLRLGQVDAAIDYLTDFNPAGEFTPIMKYGVLADAYSEKGDFSSAMSNYEKAIAQGDNELLTAHYMMKLGLLNEKEGNNEKALSIYQNIRSKYPNSVEGRDIDKYIARIN